MNLRRAAWLAAFVVASAYIAGHLIPGRRALVVTVAILVLLATGLVSLTLGLTARDRRSAFEALLREPSLDPARPIDLTRLERSAGWSAYQIVDFDSRVRPVLERIARHRLLERHHIDMAVDPTRARERLGEGMAWLVDAEPPPVTGPVRSADISRYLERIGSA